MDPCGADFVHTVAETMKLAWADREVYCGDPCFAAVPVEHLPSDAYNVERRKLIGDMARLDLQPDRIPGFDAQYNTTMGMIGAMAEGAVSRRAWHPTARR